ncbi:beta-1,6-N-acetylglucosaminyltransferase [Lautropia mirabilis]
MQARLDGMRELLARPEPWEVLINLSGQDFPLKSQEEIRAFFAANEGRNFLNIVEPEKVWNDPYARIQRIRLEPPFMKSGWNVPKLRIDRWSRHLGRARYVGGRPYMALTRSFCQHLIESTHLPRWVKTLRHGYRPVEVLPHSFIMNSPHADTVENHLLHEEDWSAGGSHPKVFTMADREHRSVRTSSLPASSTAGRTARSCGYWKRGCWAPRQADPKQADGCRAFRQPARRMRHSCLLNAQFDYV